jgi:hypothetical protein
MEPLELVDRLFPLPDDDVRAGDLVIEPHSRRLARVTAIDGEVATITFPYNVGPPVFFTIRVGELVHAFLDG